MNEQFRIAQKLGLMFRPDSPLPDDIKSWAISQLKAKSPALGVSTLEPKKFKSGQIAYNPTYLLETIDTVHINIIEKDKR